MAASSINFEQKLENGIIVYVEDGDIFDISADVLVCSSGKSEKYQGAIADQLKTRGGKRYTRSLNNLYNRKYILDVGEVYEIDSGDLTKRFSIIYLAVTCQYTESRLFNLWKNDLNTLYTKILLKADKDKRRSITIPVLGSGKAGGPVDICIEVAIKCINKFKPTSLVHVNIVTNIYMIYNKICDNIKSITPKYSKPKSSTTSSKKTVASTDTKKSQSYAQVTAGPNDYSSDNDKYRNIKANMKRGESLINKKSQKNSYNPQNYKHENHNPKDGEHSFRSKQLDNNSDDSGYDSHRHHHIYGDKNEFPESRKDNENNSQTIAHGKRYGHRGKKTVSFSEQDFDSESASNYKKMSDRDAQKTENKSNKQKSSCVDKYCEHCKKAFSGPNCTPTCGHRLCCECAASKVPCPIFQDDYDVKEDSASRKQKTCHHCEDVFTGPDCTVSCGHIVCSKCQASNYSCPYSRDNGPDVDEYLQELYSNGQNYDSEDSDDEDDHVKEEEDGVETCAICMDVAYNPKCLTKCGHVFCTECIETCFKLYKPVCPTCGTTYGILTGDQPPGVMKIAKSNIGVEGEERAGCYQINYAFSSGVQGENHPNPGTRYLPTSRTAYLPATTEGKKVCKMLIVAFKRKLIFTVGRSTTTGQENRITWNDIHHKTSTSGGPTHFGYPDPSYLNRVKEELASKGITEDDIREVRLRDSEVIYD